MGRVRPFEGTGVNEDTPPIIRVDIDYLIKIAKQARLLGLSKLPVVVTGGQEPMVVLFGDTGLSLLMPIRWR